MILCLCLVISLGVIVWLVFSCGFCGRVVGGGGEGEGPRALIVCFGKKRKKKEQKNISLWKINLSESYSVLAFPPCLAMGRDLSCQKCRLENRGDCVPSMSPRLCPPGLAKQDPCRAVCCRALTAGQDLARRLTGSPRLPQTGDLTARHDQTAVGVQRELSQSPGCPASQSKRRLQCPWLGHLETPAGEKGHSPKSASLRWGRQNPEGSWAAGTRSSESCLPLGWGRSHRIAGLVQSPECAGAQAWDSSF